MKNLSLFSLLVMIGMVLFVGGCAKEEVYHPDGKFNEVIEKMGYKPVFDTIPKHSFSGRNNLDSMPFQAPLIGEILQLNEDLKTISSSHSIAQKAINLKRNGNILKTNYALIYHFESTENGYIVTLPFVKENKVTAVLMYIKNKDNQFYATIFTKTEIELQILSSPTLLNNIYLSYMAINHFVNYQRIIEYVVDSSKLDWLNENARNVSYRPGGRECIVYGTSTPTVVSMAYVPSNPNLPPHYTWGSTTTYFIWCSDSHYHNDLIEGAYFGGSTGSPSVTQLSQTQSLINKFPGIDPNCLDFILTDQKDKLINTFSCDDNYQTKIANAINEACHNAKQTGGENFVNSIEMWEFSDAVNAALDGVDYIIEKELREECPQLYCLYNKMVKSNNNFICKYVTPTFDSDKFKLTFKVEETGAGSSAHLTYDKNSKSSTLTISPTLCNKDKSQVTLMGIMLHEFVHAELARKMSLKGYNINDINDLYKFYPKLAEYIYDIAVTQGQDQIHHNIMIQYENIINKMALALYELFDGAANGLSVDHFKMTAANGLFEAMEKSAASNSKFNNLYQEFRNKYEQKGADMQAKNLKLQGCG